MLSIQLFYEGVTVPSRQACPRFNAMHKGPRKPRESLVRSWESIRPAAFKLHRQPPPQLPIRSRLCRVVHLPLAGGRAVRLAAPAKKGLP